MQHYDADLVREKIDRQNNFKQAGERYRSFEDWEKNDLINNLVNALKPAQKQIQDRMVALFTQCDEEYGRRVAEGIKKDDSMNGGTMSTTETHKAVEQAKEISHDAKPY